MVGKNFMTKLKKIFLMALFSLVFAPMLFSQSSFACIGCKYDENEIDVTDDFIMKQYNCHNVIGYSSANGSSYTFTVDSKNIGFLKFDISSLKDEYLAGKEVSSAKINLYGKGVGTLDMYFVSDDNWVNESSYKNVQSSKIDELLGTNFISFNNINNVNNGNIVLDFNQIFIDILNNNISNSSDLAFSIALKSNNSFTINSSEKCSPNMKVGYEPVPEPSTIILGLMSVVSAFGFRRRIYS